MHVEMVSKEMICHLNEVSEPGYELQVDLNFFMLIILITKPLLQGQF